MEMRFRMGFVTGAILLALLYRFDPVWWVVLIICVVACAGMEALTHQMFDK